MPPDSPPAPEPWDDDDDGYEPPHMDDSAWEIRREGRAWGQEAMQRYNLTPGKLEMVGGKLLWSDESRVLLLGLLLENVGADRAVRLGDPAVWRAAVAALDTPGRA